MYMDIPLCLALLFVAGGLWLLTWGANRFVDGSAAVAKALKAENAAALRDLKKNPHAVSLFTQPDNSLAEKRAAIEAMPTSIIAEIEAKTAAWESFYAEARSNRLAQAADLYTAAFLMEKNRLGQGSGAPEPPSVVPTTANLRALLGGEALNAHHPRCSTPHPPHAARRTSSIGRLCSPPSSAGADST